jgi:hypothetical protein
MRQISAAILFGLVAASAHAAKPTPGESCVTVGGGYARVVATVTDPQDCCTGKMQCAQFLSTTTLVRPAHDQRT